MKVVNTPGLSGSLSVLATFPRNLVYGTDMEGDEEDIRLWFSDDDDVYKLKVLWNSGVQFYHPKQVVLAAFPAAPAISVGTGIQSIAADVAALNDANKVFKTQASE